MAFVTLARRHRRRELSDLLSIQTLAARGDKAVLDKQFKTLGEDD